MFNTFFNYLKLLFILIIFIVIIFVPILYCENISQNEICNVISDVTSEKDFFWPIPGYTRISSPFGRRNSPTAGASSYHSGIDIPAPEGTNLYALDDCYIIFASWGAGGGYTITLQSTNFPELKASYCHVSPIMYISKGDTVKKGTLVGSVGPKNVYGIINNPYKDSNGNPTNGASTGCHLHLTIKLNNNAVNPLNYFSIN